LRHAKLLPFIMSVCFVPYASASNADLRGDSPVAEISATKKEEPKYPNGLTVIDRFYRVEEGFYRGARPETENQLKTLKAYKIKTIIDVSDNDEAYEIEAARAKKLGINIVRVPLDGWNAPSDRQTADVQALLNDKSLRPIFIHCKHGRERTGVEVGLYRVWTNRWPAEKAYAEMKQMGFRTIAWNFRIYFTKTVGLD
jgi:protein tyrosine/serine phosphatase